MSSIPYDPTLVLGNIVSIERIELLDKQKRIQGPVGIAQEKLTNLMRSLYKIQMLYEQMKSMVSDKELKQFKTQEKKAKQAVSKAAVNYATKSLKAQDELYALVTSSPQTKIGGNVESPIDFSKCQPAAHQISYDSLSFDVQFFQNEKNEEATFASSVSAYVTQSSASSQKDVSSTSEMGASVNASMSAATSKHKILGTLVIIANCNHKNALMIDPFIMDPLKAVSAWNMTFPNDLLATDGESMFKAAMKPTTKDQSYLSLLSGCSLASSFVGFVHLLKQESSSSVQTAVAVAASIKAEMEQESMKGSMGASANFSASAKSMLSDSQIQNHASLICRGVIPNLKTNTMLTTVQAMQLDPKKTMQALGTMNSQTDSMSASNANAVGDAKRGKQFLELGTSHIEGTVASLSKVQDAQNKVIDTNSMFSAFSDYVEKAAKGDCGVPTTFYIKSVRKSDVAKCYIKRFYPNGATDPNSTMAQFGV